MLWYSGTPLLVLGLRSVDIRTHGHHGEVNLCKSVVARPEGQGKSSHCSLCVPEAYKHLTCIARPCQTGQMKFTVLSSQLTVHTASARRRMAVKALACLIATTLYAAHRAAARERVWQWQPNELLRRHRRATSCRDCATRTPCRCKRYRV